MDITCGLCSNEFDLNAHRPFKLLCNQHSLCLACFNNMYEAKKFITCPFDNIMKYDDRSAYQYNHDIERYLQYTQTECYYDNNIAICYDDTKGEAVCSGHGYPKIERGMFEKKINARFIADFLKYKKLLSPELRKVFLLVLKMNCQEKQSFSYGLRTLMRPLEAYFDPDLYLPNMFAFDYLFDETRLRLCSKDYADPEVGLNRPSLVALFKKMFQKAYDERAWFFTNVLAGEFKILRSNESNEIFGKLFVELVYMNKKILNDISQISCQGCKKYFRVGDRMPFILACSHIICYSCSIIFNSCKICNQILQVNNAHVDEKLYEPFINCHTCRSSEGSLFYHCNCGNLFCSKCAVQNKALNCQDCLRLNDLGYFINLKVSKSALNSLRYLKIDIICYKCRINPADFFSRYYKIAMCDICDQRTPDADCVRLVSGYNFDLLLIKIFEENLSQHYPQIDFKPLRINKKLKIISDAFSNNQGNINIWNTNFLQIKEIKLYSKIYPVNKQDRRFFLSKKPRSIQLNFSQNIYLCGVVAAGRIDSETIDATVTVTSSHQQIQIPGRILGKYGYFFIDQQCYNSTFAIQVRYHNREKLFTGVSFVDTIMESNLILTKYAGKVTHCVSGPILGVLYALQ